MPGNYGYGTFNYGGAQYGAATAPPSSPDFDIYDFCYPVDAIMLNLFAYSQVTSFRGYGAPHVHFVGNELCLLSDDGTDSGLRIDISITNSFTIQMSVKPTDLPDDFSDLVNKRFFFGGYNPLSKMIGVALSKNQGIALSHDGLSVVDILPNSERLIDDPSLFYTFRLVVDSDNNRGHIYVTERDLVPYIGHQLRYTVSLLDTPAGATNHFLVSCVGTAADPTEVCLGCLRMHGGVKIPNRRPIAVPGSDKTRSEGQYAAFDGSASYDPDPLDTIKQFWWTVTYAPDSSEFLLSGLTDTPFDLSGFTNTLLSAVGTFSDVRQGDLIIVGDYKSTVMYVAGDGSWLVTTQYVIPAGLTNSEWTCIRQYPWEGNWNPSMLIVVLDSLTAPPALPVEGDSYRVLPGAIGAWLNRQNTIATWTAGAWSFRDPVDQDVLFDIAENMVRRYLYLPPAPPPHNGIWYEDEVKPWELAHWQGRAEPIGKMLTSKRGLHVIELVVNDGELDSLPAEVLLNVYVSDVALGLIPDLSFVWNYISDFWDLIEDRDKVEALWGSITQLGASELMSLWQHDYSKSIRDVQRTFQRQWLDYVAHYEEPDYIELPATIENSLNVSGYSTNPNVQVVDPVNPSALIDSKTAYDLGIVVAGVTDSHVLVLEGVCYQIIRSEEGASTIVITKQEIVTGGTRPKAWMIRPTVTSRTSDFSKLGVSAGDEMIFEVSRNDTTTEYHGYVWGSRERLISFDDGQIKTLLLDPDVTVLFKGVIRRSFMRVDDLVVSIPRLQEVIALDRVEGAPSPLAEERDFRISNLVVSEQKITFIQFLNAWSPQVEYGFDGDYVAVNQFYSVSADFVSLLGDPGADISGYVIETVDGRFRLSTVVDANTLELMDDSLDTAVVNRDWSLRRINTPPETLWAEVTFLDNRPTIEDNFGRLIGFTLDDLNARTDNLDYLSAVRGLWYAYWFGPTLHNLQSGAQILLGLPFAEVSGTIVDMRSPYDATRDRILVRSDDNPVEIISYYFPTTVGIAESRETGIDLTIGDHVNQFDPLSRGVQVDDWVSSPNWINIFTGSGDIEEVQKIHHFLVRVSADVFDLTNLVFMMGFIKKIKPTYTFPFFVVLKQLYDIIDVLDPVVVGPVIPSSGDYPSTWAPFNPPTGWVSPAPNEENSLVAVNRVIPPPYDITQRWPYGRFVTPLSQHPTNPYGNLHLFDTTGRVPDGWEDSWPGLPSVHVATRAEGARKFDDTDESGHAIHKYDDPSSTNPYYNDLFLARDGHMESPDLTFWPAIGGGVVRTKVLIPRKSGTRSLHIQAPPWEGVYNEFPSIFPLGGVGTPQEGFQVAVTGWFYLVSGQAVFRFRDQDGVTYLAEVHRNIPTGTWTQFVLHTWKYMGSSSVMRFEALGGPTGAEFYLDAVEAFVANVPWSAAGYDRSIFGRTGGYTDPGGDPDEFFQAALHVLVP